MVIPITFQKSAVSRGGKGGEDARARAHVNARSLSLLSREKLVLFVLVCRQKPLRYEREAFGFFPSMMAN